MTLQTDLQAAVAKASAAAQKLHDVVHGDGASAVATENGAVKTVAKTIADNEAEIAASRVELDQKVADAAASAASAAADADRAEQAANALAFPIAVADGGTGAATAAGARDNLGLGSLATKSGVATADLDAGAVTWPKLQNLASGRILGRSAAGSGIVEEIAVGTGLLLAAGVLSNPGGIKLALLRDEKPDGTDAGGSTGGSWTTRDLNTEAVDPDGIVSLSANQFTLEAGNYLLLAQVPFNIDNGRGFRARIRNVSDAATVAMGQSGYIAASNAAISAVVPVIGYVALVAAKSFAIQSQSSATIATFGLGRHDQMSLGAEVYTELLIVKIG